MTPRSELARKLADIDQRLADAKEPLVNLSISEADLLRGMEIVGELERAKRELEAELQRENNS